MAQERLSPCSENARRNAHWEYGNISGEAWSGTSTDAEAKYGRLLFISRQYGPEYDRGWFTGKPVSISQGPAELCAPKPLGAG